MTPPRSKPPSEGSSGHLERMSGLRKRIAEIGLKPSLLVVEDQAQEAKFMETPLKALFGDAGQIMIAPTVDAMISALESKRGYEVILLDDHMNGGIKTEQTLPMIRRMRPDCPVIVVSGLLTRSRIAELQRLEADAILSKDDMDSLSLGAAILKVLGHGKV